MAKNKTVATKKSPVSYIKAISPASKQVDAQRLLEMCERLTGEKAKMWGPSIVGAGTYHYKYKSGREGNMFLAGFAARKNAIVVYLGGIIKDQQALLDRLGPHKMGKACLYVKNLEQINLSVLEELMAKSIAATKARYPA